MSRREAMKLAKAEGVTMTTIFMRRLRKQRHEAGLNAKGDPMKTPAEIVVRRVRQLKPHNPGQVFVGRFKYGSRNKLTGGVHRITVPQRSGNKTSAWVAVLYVLGRRMRRSFSINRCGESGAKLAASLQRLVWMIDFGLWNPRDGDPLAILSYSEAHKGNRDYENCVNEERSSRWIEETDDESI